MGAGRGLPVSRHEQKGNENESIGDQRKGKHGSLLRKGRGGRGDRADPAHVRLSDDGGREDPHYAGRALGQGLYDRDNDDDQG